jgi:hypothetical protein
MKTKVMETNSGFKLYEKTFYSNLEVKYIFQKASYSSKYLFIIFSGFDPPDSCIQYSYKYVRTLQNIDLNKLFVLDSYGPRGCYYLGKKMRFEFEKSIISLISYLIKKEDILWKNIISIGTSKGGSAALYYGIKYGFAKAIVGCPQIFIADYLKEYSMETLKYIVGDNLPKKNIISLNNLILNQLIKMKETNIFIVSNQDDEQFEVHINPFQEYISDKLVNYELVLDSRIMKHSDIGKVFPEHLIQEILKL